MTEAKAVAPPSWRHLLSKPAGCRRYGASLTNFASSSIDSLPSARGRIDRSPYQEALMNGQKELSSFARGSAIAPRHGRFRTLGNPGTKG